MKESAIKNANVAEECVPGRFAHGNGAEKARDCPRHGFDPNARTVHGPANTPRIEAAAKPPGKSGLARL